MKRFTCSLIILLALVGCSRKGPTPTSPPSPSPTESQPALPTTNPTPPGSPVPRITIVPSATRIQSAQEQVIWEGTAIPTGTATLLPSSTSSSTPTPRIIIAGPTETPRPSLTATVAESPLPESPLPTPSLTGTSATASSDATEVPDTATPDTTTPLATSGEGSATPTATLTVSPSATATTAPSGEAWSFKNVFTYYDEDFLEFYIWGEVVNNTGSDQRITSLMPVVYDGNGAPVTSEEDVLGLWDYEKLLDLVSIAPEKSLAFSFLVFLPDETPFSQDYEVLVRAETVEPARDDLDITDDEFDLSDWPDYLYVDGFYQIPSPNLNAYVAVVVTVYDEDEHVIGVGWTYETAALYLEAGAHDFEVIVEMWEIVSHLNLDAYSYKVQVFGE